MLGRRIAARPRPPATVRDLEIALLEEWNSIPQSLIDNLIASMANRYWDTSKRASQKLIAVKAPPIGSQYDATTVGSVGILIL
ncbi:hypothetical protein TNCV_4790481 [Trichonephila clavipes]|nr:hypothetical protein TNCV_4790481 [Trichonephila clavipes]